MRVALFVIPIFLIVLLGGNSIQAHQQVVVVPLGGGHTLKNIVTVAKSGGNFTDPVAAMASITDATYSNPYVLFIGPGEYTLSSRLEVKVGVSLVGSGRDTTILTGAVSTDNINGNSALIEGNSGTSIRSMTIKNSGGGQYAFGIYSYDPYPLVVDDVKIEVSGAAHNRGVFLDEADSATISNCEIRVQGTSGGAELSYGIVINDDYATIKDVTIRVYAGQYARGIYSADGDDISIKEVDIKVSGATSSNYGFLAIGSTNKIYESIIESTDTAMAVSSGTTRVMRSTLIGGVSATGTLSCTNADDGAGVELNGSCL